MKQKSIMAAVFLVFMIFPEQAVSQTKSEEPEKFELTINNIMKGDELVGTAPEAITWSWDGKMLYFQWQKPDEDKSKLYALKKKELHPKEIKDEDILKNIPLSQSTEYRFPRLFSYGFDIKFDRQKKRALLTKNGDLSLLDLKTGKIKPLINTDDRESNADFCFDQNSIYFTREDNLYTLSLKDGSLKQLTSFDRKSTPEGEKPSELDKWYSEQQKKLFEEFSKPREMRSHGINPSLGSSRRRKPFHLSENQSVIGLELSPDEKYVIFTIFERDNNAKSTIVPNYVTRTGYTDTITSHTKAAESSRLFKAGIMSTEDGNINWIDYGQDERMIFPSENLWSPDEKKCIHKAESEDRKDTWLFLLEVSTGKTTVVEHVHDNAWIGPLSLTNVLWWPDSQYLSYISEKNGFAHLYKTSWDGNTTKMLTEGNYEVYSAFLSKDAKKWYLTTNEEHPGERHFYSMPAEGGDKTKITHLPGWNEVILSPDESFLAILHSYTNMPPELYIQENNPNKQAKRITLSTTEFFRNFSWHDPELITFRSRDNIDIYARLYRPQKWHPSKPSIIFIHGAGYLQNAHKGWSSYFREYMFHNFLMEHGYLVMDIDYRGSAGYGRDCRTAIYRHMGGKDLDDIVDGVRFLVNELGADKNRIGVYGGSYGGFLTLMAMFTTPDVFKAGAALRPVTDWAHYHSMYTVDILNLPHKDSEAYQRSSPINFAEGLKGHLLICHGMVDTNVHFQDTVRLVQRLIELRKENWETAIYPVEGHSFHNSSSWADEYKRIFKLFENTLK